MNNDIKELQEMYDALKKNMGNRFYIKDDIVIENSDVPVFFCNYSYKRRWVGEVGWLCNDAYGDVVVPDELRPIMEKRPKQIKITVDGNHDLVIVADGVAYDVDQNSAEMMLLDDADEPDLVFSLCGDKYILDTSNFPQDNDEFNFLRIEGKMHFKKQSDIIPYKNVESTD